MSPITTFNCRSLQICISHTILDLLFKINSPKRRFPLKRGRFSGLNYSGATKYTLVEIESNYIFSQFCRYYIKHLVCEKNLMTTLLNWELQHCKELYLYSKSKEFRCLCACCHVSRKLLNIK